jgi:hypothetical protein
VPPSVFLRDGYDLHGRVNVNPLPVTVEVDQNGQPIDHRVTVHVVESSVDGGNIRGVAPPGPVIFRPHAWLFERDDLDTPTAATRVNQVDLGGSQSDVGIDIPTSTDAATQGQATFIWVAPEVSGTETVTVSVPAERDLQAITRNIVVRQNGLDDMPAGQTYRLIGQTPIHPANHWASPNMIAHLQAAAQNYIDNQNNDQQLQNALRRLRRLRYGFPGATFPNGTPDVMQINDISLPWGGLFDTDGDWTTPHGGHRWGDMADFRTNYLVIDPRDPHRTALGDSNEPPPVSVIVLHAHDAMFQDFVNALRAAGGQILFEGNHIHVVFR